jgi:novobiocin biosynthesis protein NovU/D-mycarose 3-C-methyltransferase
MPEDLFETITACRICHSEQIRAVLDLGAQPPANSLRDRREGALPVIPLSICRCGNCATVQLTETVKPEYLFRNYVWVTGTSATAKDYSRRFFEESARRCGDRSLFVVEVASNDGTFLGRFQERGHRVLGVDPAENIARIANERGVATWPEFFGRKVAGNIIRRHGHADFAFARNVLPHVEHVHDVVSGMGDCLSAEGTGAIEFHYAQCIVDGLQYDSIYHEHLFYFSIRSMVYLLEQHGLWAFDLIESPISGGSIVLYFSKDKRARSQAFTQKLETEDQSGLGLQETWDRFARECLAHRERLAAMINEEVARGTTIVGYGASARSSTLLNFCGINDRHLACIADQSPLKHNKYTAGTNVLIVPPEVALSKKPAAVLLLAWNFKDEVLALLRGRYQFHGRVIIPLPNDREVIVL